MLLLCGASWAQSNRNVLGAPVYYDTMGNVIGQQADSFYHRPKHHFHNRLEYDFSSFFLEGEALLGPNDLAIGAQMAWVPQRWGVYCSGLTGVYYNYLSAGPVVRLSDCGDRIDWQMYAGLVASHRWGAEMGFRMAAPRQWGDFCWTSMSLSFGYANRMSYFTLGFSLTLSSVVALTIW